MTLEIVKSNELKQEGIAAMVYSPSGFGKTTLLGTLPEKLTLICDIEGGTASISDRAHDVIRIKTLKELIELYEALDNGELRYRFVCLDSVSELEKAVQFSRKHIKGKTFLSMKEYGETAEIMREYVRKFRNLKYQGVTVVFTALEMLVDIVSETDTRTKRVPLVSRKFYEEFCGLMDLVGRLVIDKESGERALLFEGNDHFLAKTRIKGVEQIEQPDLTTLFRKIYGIDPKP
jgi:phage nucleotide-binding protein